MIDSRGSMSSRVDTLRIFETPEGVELTLQVAGPLARGGAFLLDLLVRVAFYYILALLVGSLGILGSEAAHIGRGLLLLGIFLLEWFYGVLFELGKRGATPGKRVFGLRVVHRDGTPVGVEASLIRNLLRFVDFLPFAYGIGIVSSMCSRDFSRLGDRAAGTLVIHQRVETPPTEVGEGAVWSPPLALTATEQSAVLDYADRFTQWTPARREELADLLQPLTGVSGTEGAQRVLGLARWLRR